jgi:outer membrane receptor protein involved in Fe transport
MSGKGKLIQSRCLVLYSFLCCAGLLAQSLTTGDITGTLTDPSKAVLPNVTVTLKSLDTGVSETAVTNQAGVFRFRLLKPGTYSVSVSQTGFRNVERKVEVAVGQIATADLALQLGETTQVVEVSAASPLVNPQASVNTAFTPEQLQQLPSAGGDITNIAFTTPGTVVNVTGGYGNFTVNGLPATSNLFTVNGENDMDPYFNINNSGASNLTIGQNELQEATVVANPYAGQYGQLAGAQVTYVTKSGSNQFHGNAIYWWNGRAMNSNDWFNNYYGVSKPFSNANQWAASVGGPIRKNKTFFFVDNEGFRFVLPNVFSNTIPTPAFASAVLANVQAKQPNEYTAYQTMMNLWLNSPGAANAVPIANSSYCNSVVLPGYHPAATPCAAKSQSSATALGSEWILSGRVDQKIGDRDNAFFRYKADHGTQPTLLDPISANFNAISQQPSWDSQFQETHVLSAQSTNSFTAAASHYVAQFQQNAQLVASTFPYQIVDSGAVPFTGFNDQHAFPQGRNITQYQFIDDFTRIHGSHNFKFGANFRRYDVSDHNFFYNTPAVYFGYVSNGLQNFVNGLGYQYRQSLNLASDVPIAMWGLGLYGQDEWNLAPNFKLTLGLRVERNSNPVCNFNCFANFVGPTNTLPSFTSANPGSVPYASDIAYNQNQAYPGIDALVWSPRIGFSWSPAADRKTVISGGFGNFHDSPPAGLVDDLLANPPVSVNIRVRPTGGVLPFDPAGGAATFQASANAFNVQQTYGQISTALTNLGSQFAAPAFTSLSGTIHAPQYQEWNFQLQRQLRDDLLLTLNYVGNHGIRLLYSNAWPNAYDQYGLYPGVAGISANPAVPNYGTVTQIQNGAVSNYNGLSITLTKRFASWVSGHLNYTWSHNLDECSNGCIFSYGDSTFGQINPLSLRANNYGNSDYDIRHNLTADFVLNPTIHRGPWANRLINGWQFSGKLFWRTGLPFSVSDNNTALGNGGGALFATPLGSGWGQGGCGSGAAGDPGVATPCINANAYLNSALINNFTAWSPETRNQLRGPHFFDMDVNLYRNFKLQERVNLGFGMQAFNVFNHPNFGLPDAGLGDSTFGLISGMAGSPTSPYGTFLGFDSSVRVAQISARLTF